MPWHQLVYIAAGIAVFQLDHIYTALGFPPDAVAGVRDFVNSNAPKDVLMFLLPAAFVHLLHFLRHYRSIMHRRELRTWRRKQRRVIRAQRKADDRERLAQQALREEHTRKMEAENLAHRKAWEAAHPGIRYGTREANEILGRELAERLRQARAMNRPA